LGTKVTLVGAIDRDSPEGDALGERFTVPENPFTLFMVILTFPVLPLTTASVIVLVCRLKSAPGLTEMVT
jgi:hypothetical protein